MPNFHDVLCEMRGMGIYMNQKNMKNLDFINLLNRLPAREYLLAVIAYGAAPTIREEKPSSLITFTKVGRNLYGLWNTFKSDVCRQLGLGCVQLGDRQDSVRVLFYKQSLLEECINRKDCREFLNAAGYEQAQTVEECINKLKARFEHVCPHEVGIFLGIPVEDVTGFINHKGENYLLCSYWKVYHEPEKACSMFKSFDKARNDIRESITKRNFDFRIPA